jgi:hypothetical protein
MDKPTNPIAAVTPNITIRFRLLASAIDPPVSAVWLTTRRLSVDGALGRIAVCDSNEVAAPCEITGVVLTPAADEDETTA